MSCSNTFSPFFASQRYLLNPGENEVLLPKGSKLWRSDLRFGGLEGKYAVGAEALDPDGVKTMYYLDPSEDCPPGNPLAATVARQLRGGPGLQGGGPVVNPLLRPGTGDQPGLPPEAPTRRPFPLMPQGPDLTPGDGGVPQPTRQVSGCWREAKPYINTLVAGGPGDRKYYQELQEQDCKPFVCFACTMPLACPPTNIPGNYGLAKFTIEFLEFSSSNPLVQQRIDVAMAETLPMWPAGLPFWQGPPPLGGLCLPDSNPVECTWRSWPILGTATDVVNNPLYWFIVYLRLRGPGSFIHPCGGLFTSSGVIGIHTSNTATTGQVWPWTQLQLAWETTRSNFGYDYEMCEPATYPLIDGNPTDYDNATGLYAAKSHTGNACEDSPLNWCSPFNPPGPPLVPISLTFRIHPI